MFLDQLVCFLYRKWQWGNELQPPALHVDDVFCAVESFVEQERYVFQFELLEKLKNVLQGRDIADAALIDVVE